MKGTEKNWETWASRPSLNGINWPLFYCSRNTHYVKATLHWIWGHDFCLQILSENTIMKLIMSIPYTECLLKLNAKILCIHMLHSRAFLMDQGELCILVSFVHILKYQKSNTDLKRFLLNFGSHIMN